MKRKAVITHPRGRYRKQFKFLLIGDNGEPLSDRDFYNNRHDLVVMLKKYFPAFVIEDKTIMK